MVRGFPDNLITRLREAPCGALLDVLFRQLSLYDIAQHHQQTLIGDIMTNAMPHGFQVPGEKVRVRVRVRVRDRFRARTLSF